MRQIKGPREERTRGLWMRRVNEERDERDLVRGTERRGREVFW